MMRISAWGKNKPFDGKDSIYNDQLKEKCAPAFQSVKNRAMMRDDLTVQRLIGTQPVAFIPIF